MGQAVSIHDIAPKTPSTLAPKSSIKSTPTISRSTSNRSLSQLSNISNISTISTISMSERFISYENTIIHLPTSSVSPRTNKTNSWKLNITPKYNDSIMAAHYNEDEYICIVFGICDAALLEKGYKHKYYGYGYSVTYCENIKFQSLATRFKKTDEIMIKYDQWNGKISFWKNGEKKKTIIQIDAKIKNVITIKSYDDAYDVQII